MIDKLFKILFPDEIDRLVEKIVVNAEMTDEDLQIYVNNSAEIEERLLRRSQDG